MWCEIVWNERTLAVVLVFAIPLVAIIGGLWFKSQKDAAETELKQRMVERGMSAEEIERVLAAKGSNRS